MTEKEMIEEMANLLTGCCKRLDEKGQPIGFKCLHGCEYFDKETSICSSFNQKEAKTLYNAGYRKVPEGAVVLTKKEHQKYLAYKIIEPQIKGCLDRERELERQLDQARKETAREILNKVDYESNGQTKQITDLLRRKYGVEVE